MEKMHKISFYISRKLHNRAKAYCEKKEMKLAQFIRFLLKEATPE